MARFGDGLEVDLDLVRAAERASACALEPLAGRAPDLACVFVCGDDPAECADALVRAGELTGAGTTIGCTAGGVIGGRRAVEVAPSVSVWAGVLPAVRRRAFHLEVLRTGDGLAVLGIPRPAAAGQVVAVLLADPYSFPVDGFVERSNDLLTGVPFVGGVATGLRGAGSTRLLVDGQVHERGAVGVLLEGLQERLVAAATLVSQGCRPIGPPMTVTAAEGNALLGLAGQPALERLEQLVQALPPEDQALASRGLHLGIAMDEYVEEHARGGFLIRGVIGADEQRGALLVGDVVEVGRTVQFQVRDAASASADLAQALRRLRAEGPLDPVEGALLFSCNGRGSGLFTSADHDLLAVRAGLTTGGVAGFFAAGEIAPVGGRNHLHGFTASLLALGSPRPGAT